MYMLCIRYVYDTNGKGWSRERCWCNCMCCNCLHSHCKTYATPYYYLGNTNVTTNCSNTFFIDKFSFRFSLIHVYFLYVNRPRPSAGMYSGQERCLLLLWKIKHAKRSKTYHCYLQYATMVAIQMNVKSVQLANINYFMIN